MEATMINTIKSLVIGQASAHPVYECRQCGTSVDPGVEVCPSCSSESIVHYEIG